MTELCGRRPEPFEADRGTKSSLEGGVPLEALSKLPVEITDVRVLASSGTERVLRRFVSSQF